MIMRNIIQFAFMFFLFLPGVTNASLQDTDVLEEDEKYDFHNYYYSISHGSDLGFLATADNGTNLQDTWLKYVENIDAKTYNELEF